MHLTTDFEVRLILVPIFISWDGLVVLDSFLYLNHMYVRKTRNFSYCEDFLTVTRLVKFKEYTGYITRDFTVL